MKHRVLSACACALLLTSCQSMGEGGRYAEEQFKKAALDTRDAIERTVTYYPEKQEYKPIPYAFCYRVMQDINCYDRPLPDARLRLVGWQGRDGTFIKASHQHMLPPPAASVQQMPNRTAASLPVQSQPPAQRSAAAQLPNTVAPFAPPGVVLTPRFPTNNAPKAQPNSAVQTPLAPVFVGAPPAVKEQDVKIKVTNAGATGIY